MTTANDLTTRLLLQQNHSPEDTAAWATAALPWPPTRIATEARTWADHGITGATAVTWCCHGWTAKTASPWHRRGYTATQARFVLDRLEHAQDDPDPGDHSAPVDPPSRWRDSELEPALVTVCIASGTYTIDAGRRLAQRFARDPRARGTAELLLALTHGIDLRAMDHDT